MFKEFKQAETFVHENHIQQVDLKWNDLWGRLHHITLSAREFTPELMQAGVGFDASSVGFKGVSASDMVLVPDLLSGFVDTFFEVPTLSFLCDILEADTKQIFSGAPREVSRRAEAYMQSSRIADTSLWGPEFEFYVFNRLEIENGTHVASYRVEAEEADWTPGQQRPAYPIPRLGGYHAAPPADRLFNLRSRMCILLEAAGVPVKYHHHETGSGGHSEIETPMMPLLAAGDASVKVKTIARMVAQADGKVVTFLPKPLFSEAGSGMHFHQQLFSGTANAFYDPKGPSLLSKTALYYIGGLLTHAPAVLALTNPSTNSYRRLVPGFGSPVKSFFSSGNRSAAIRIPRYASQPDTVRMEFRPPDGTCNPYLAMPAMLMAGLDGIRRKIDPAESGFGPIDEDVFGWSEERRATIKSLPTSLDEALDALEADQQFLLEGGVFSAEMLRFWIQAKRKESMDVRVRPHPLEIQMYYDI